LGFAGGGIQDFAGALLQFAGQQTTHSPKAAYFWPLVKRAIIQMGSFGKNSFHAG
jgi:hypothetical protein